MADMICEVMDMALKDMVPLISINECAGAHIQEGVRSLAGFGKILQKNIFASGVIPQISAVLGPCAGGAVYSPALTDFTVMVKDSSYMFITGPGVVKSVTGEEVTKEELGGAGVHSIKSGVAHFVAENEFDALQTIRLLLGYLPLNNKEQAPCSVSYDPVDRIDESLNNIVPANPKKPYDIYKVIGSLVDDGEFMEVHTSWAKNMVVGLARMNGRPVGIVANQPKILAGVLDSDASRKAARFVRFCDAFNIPVITLVDVPGFLCGTQQEYAGVITQGAKLVYAYGEATVPKVTVVLRKAFGGAYVSMCCKQLGGDVNFAWPSAEIAVMGAESAAEVIKPTQKDYIDDYKSRISNPQNALDNGSLDEIIEPATTRKRVIEALEKINDTKPAGPLKKHNNMPL
jgi:acetyl-CoA carboxylase carboxyltransferase component